MSVIGSLFGPGGGSTRPSSPPPPPSEQTRDSQPAPVSGAATPPPTGAPAAGMRPAAAGTSTPVDAPAVRRDFTTAAQDAAPTEAEARRFAIAAQVQERQSALVERLATPVAAPENVTAKPEAEAKEPAARPVAYSDSLKALRGQAEPSGALLDRAA